MVKKSQRNLWEIGFYVTLIALLIVGYSSSNLMQEIDVLNSKISLMEKNQEKQKEANSFFQSLKKSGIQTSNQPTKGSYSYTYTGNGENTYVHRPDDIITINVAGNNNQIEVSKETEIKKVTLAGTGNRIILCKDSYPTPETTKTGISNQITYINC